LTVLEANVDDMTPETSGYVMEVVLGVEGVLDVWYTNLHMKKTRPGLTLHVLCRHEVVEGVLLLLFRETPTLGVRRVGVERYALRRKVVEVVSEYGGGTIRAKVSGVGMILIIIISSSSSSSSSSCSSSRRRRRRRSNNRSSGNRLTWEMACHPSLFPDQ